MVLLFVRPGCSTCLTHEFSGEDAQSRERAQQRHIFNLRRGGCGEQPDGKGRELEGRPTSSQTLALTSTGEQVKDTKAAISLASATLARAAR